MKIQYKIYKEKVIEIPSSFSPGYSKEEICISLVFNDIFNSVEETIEYLKAKEYYGEFLLIPVVTINPE